MTGTTKPKKLTPEELSEKIESLQKYRNLYAYDRHNDGSQTFYYVTGISAGAGVLTGKILFTYLRVNFVEEEEMTCTASYPFVCFVKEMDEFLEDMYPLQGEYVIHLNF